jgi:hypothetical protein
VFLAQLGDDAENEGHEGPGEKLLMSLDLGRVST